MDSREIEAQIKGLLGLQLGSEAAESTVPPGAYPRHKNRYGSALSTPKFQNWFRQLNYLSAVLTADTHQNILSYFLESGVFIIKNVN
jgi:hypothetical protein